MAGRKINLMRARVCARSKPKTMKREKKRTKIKYGINKCAQHAIMFIALVTMFRITI